MWPALISGFCSMKQLGVFQLLLDGMPVHRRITPSIRFAGTHLYTWVERSTVRVKCLAQEHNAISPARTRTQTTRSRVQRTNYEATVPRLVTSNEKLLKTANEWKQVIIWRLVEKM